MAKAARRRTIVRYVRRGARRARSTTVPIAVLAGLAPGVARSIEGFKKDGFRGASYRLCNDFTGYDAYNTAWNASELKYGLLPLVAGFAVHWLVGGKLGVNRALGRANVPFIRL